MRNLLVLACALGAAFIGEAKAAPVIGFTVNGSGFGSIESESYNPEVPSPPVFNYSGPGTAEFSFDRGTGRAEFSILLNGSGASSIMDDNALFAWATNADDNFPFGDSVVGEVSARNGRAGFSITDPTGSFLRTGILGPGSYGGFTVSKLESSGDIRSNLIFNFSFRIPSVPEPSSLALLGIAGVVGIAVARRPRLA